MAHVSVGRSTLNPNAPLFIPAAFRQVEDFSPEWWQLVTTSTWFHNYWLSQHQGEDGFYDNTDDDDFGGIDVVDLLPDTFDLCAAEDLSNMESQFEEFLYYSENDPLATIVNKNDSASGKKNLSLLRSLEDNGAKSPSAPAKYAEKPAKSFNAKPSTRRIQQPR